MEREITGLSPIITEVILQGLAQAHDDNIPTPEELDTADLSKKDTAAAEGDSASTSAAAKMAGNSTATANATAEGSDNGEASSGVLNIY